MESNQNPATRLLIDHVLVAPAQMEIFTKRMDALNTKAIKFGLTPISLKSITPMSFDRRVEADTNDRWVHTEFHKVLPGITPKNPVTLNRIELEYPIARLGNWNVVGRLEKAEAGTLSYSFSRDADAEKAVLGFSNQPLCCEHCNTKRKRNDAYILQDTETGKFMEVGTSCLEDFTGIDPKAALFLQKLYDAVRIIDGDERQYGSLMATDVHLHDFMRAVAFCANKHGFITSSKAKEDPCALPTYTEAASLRGDIQKAPKLRIEFMEQYERNSKVASSVIEWVRTRPVDPESQFDKNISILFANDYISQTNRHLAFAAAALPMYQREMERQFAQEHERQNPSQHVGAEGEKRETILSIQKVLGFDTKFGLQNIVTLRDQDNNAYKWKSGSCPQEIKDGAGKAGRFAFTVKAHSEYKGLKQTEILRVKLKEWVSPENAANIASEPPAAAKETTGKARTKASAKNSATADPAALASSPSQEASQENEARWTNALCVFPMLGQDDWVNSPSPVDLQSLFQCAQACMESADPEMADEFERNLGMPAPEFYAHFTEIEALAVQLQIELPQAPIASLETDSSRTQTDEFESPGL